MAGRASGLQRRLAIVLVGLVITTAAVQGFGYWAAERWVERASLQGLLERELAHRIDSQTPPTAATSSDPTLRYYRPRLGSLPPAALADLDAGWHDGVQLDSHDYRALVRDVGPGDRAYLVYDSASLEGREQRLILVFGLGVLTVAALAFWASRRLSARALAPLAALVAQIRALNPEARGARLRVDGDVELQVIAEALNGYMRELDALVERERAFASAASHELRTPLAVIAGARELLAAGTPAPARPLARIERAVSSAMHDLDALLALSRQREPPPARRLALEQLLPEWAAAHVEAQPVAALGWQLAAVTLETPPGSLHIVFTNLLRNALRAAGPQGRVDVVLTHTGLVVLDDGPGIPAAELPLVFEPHVRGRDGGTGIGLYVARTLAQRQGWQLQLENRAEGGAAATLRWA